MAKTRFGNLDGVRTIKNNSGARATILSAGMFVAILIAFLLLVSVASRGSVNEQREVLAKAIQRGVIQCYVTEGRYPESFEYLKDNYGIIYDDKLFRVDYVIYGSNMKPDVSIIQLED